MAQFLKGNQLNYEIEKLFEEADETLCIISPYIQLHDRYKASLSTKLNVPHLKLTVLFGKNEEDMSKSMKQTDFDFFKQFPNIEILYEKRLHAKYYANETKGILTSMNLYGYSQNNNIEVGVLMERTSAGLLTGSNKLDNETWNYFQTVLDQAEVLFDKQPIFEKRSFLRGEKYIESEIVTDIISEFFNASTYKKVFKNAATSHPVSEIVTNKMTGYCIRTGKEIPFNIEKPMDYSAYKSWSKYGDGEYPEKYCHFSGEPSNGQTCVNRPILSKNWTKAKQKFGL